MPAGAIGEQLGPPANSLSFHLGRLVNAGLIRGWRPGFYDTTDVLGL